MSLKILLMSQKFLLSEKFFLIQSNNHALDSKLFNGILHTHSPAIGWVDLLVGNNCAVDIHLISSFTFLDLLNCLYNAEILSTRLLEMAINQMFHLHFNNP